MSDRNSKIIIAQNIKLDKNHLNVLNYTTNQMLQLLNTSGIYVAERNDYSFVRRTGTIAADFPYSAAATCNYMAFQNPDFSNKWFFAWIDSIEYKSDNSIEIAYTIDNWATWYDDFNFASCFVEREHVSDDTMFSHTLPEPINACENIDVVKATKYFNDLSIIVIWTPYQFAGSFFYIINKYTGFFLVYRYDCTYTGMQDLASDLQTGGLLETATILTAFIYPTNLLPVNSRTAKGITRGELFSDTLEITASTGLHGYVPQNNKIFTGQFCKYMIHNGVNSISLIPELWRDTNGKLVTNIYGVCADRGFMNAIPNNYDGATGDNVLYTLPYTDFDQVATMADSYQAWLVYGSKSSREQMFHNVFGAFAGGGLKGGGVGAGGGLLSTLLDQTVKYNNEDIEAKYQKDYTQTTGSPSFNSFIDKFGFTAIHNIPILSEVKRIDNWFSMFGYRVSTIKTPEIDSRAYWNFIRTEGRAIYGAMPETVIEDVNAIMNRGVTVWHGHDYMLNYFIGGTSMQNPII